MSLQNDLQRSRHFSLFASQKSLTNTHHCNIGTSIDEADPTKRSSIKQELNTRWISSTSSFGVTFEKREVKVSLFQVIQLSFLTCSHRRSCQGEKDKLGSTSTRFARLKLLYPLVHDCNVILHISTVCPRCSPVCHYHKRANDRSFIGHSS